MKTGLTKKQKRTSIYFTEADEFVEICIYNTGFKKANGICRQISHRMPSTGRQRERLQDL